MAKQMGMTQSAWSRRVTGDLPFDVAELDRIASILNVPITRFLGDPAGTSTISRKFADSHRDAFAAAA